MFANKHVIAALLIAPILAVLAWLAVDRLVAEQPEAAVAGRAYPLVAKPGCRYAGGQCELVNGDVVLRVSSPTAGRIVVQGSHLLTAIQIALRPPEREFSEPRPMIRQSDDGLVWALESEFFATNSDLRLLATIGGANYYVDTSLAFVATE